MSIREPGFLTDGHLLHRFLNAGDPQAFEELFERSAPRLEHLARRLGIPASDRDDFAQDVFLSVLVEAARFDERRSFSAWVGGIAWRKALSARRRFLQRRLPRGAFPPRGADMPVDTLESAEVRSAVARSIERLPAAYREVVELYYLQELPASAIAQRLGRPASTIRTQIARGLERLRELLPVGIAPGVLLLFRLRQSRRFPTALRPAPEAASHVALGGLAAGVGLVLLGSIWLALESGPRPEPRVASAAARGLDAPPEIIAVETPPPRSPVTVLSASPILEPLETPSSTLTQPTPALPASSRLHLRFVDARTREPVPDLVFACEPWSPSNEGGLSDLVAAAPAGCSDSRGEAVLEGVPNGSIRLRFNATEGSRIYELDGDLDLVVPVDGTAAVTGTVVDERGEPVEGAEVWTDEVVFGSFLRSFPAARTQADGSFRLAFSHGSPKKIWARVPGRSCSRVFVLSLVPLPTESVRLVLEPAHGSLVGRVVRGDGTPESGALMTLQASDGEPQQRAVFQRNTDDQGRFAFDTLPARPHELLAVTADGSLARGSIDLTGQSEASCEVVLERGSTVQGNASGSDGRPVVGALVAALPLIPRPERWELWRIATTDAEGSFRLEGVLPGRVDLLLVDPESALVLARECVEIATGDPFVWSPRHDPSRALDQAHGLRRFLVWRLAPGQRMKAPLTPSVSGAKDD